MANHEFVVLAWTWQGALQVRLCAVDHLDVPLLGAQARELERLGYQNVFAGRVPLGNLNTCLRQLEALRLADPFEAGRWAPDISLVDALDTLAAPAQVPAAEVDGLARVLGLHRLASFLGTPEEAVQDAAQNRTPVVPATAAKVRYLAIVVANLATLYNDFGVRRFFDEPRHRLGGKTPADILTGKWDPPEPGPTKILSVARATRP